jgi:hypothetical protein
MTTAASTTDTTPAPEGLFDGTAPCSAYSRADALADGVLVDVCAPALRVGFRAHSAMTEGLYETLGGEDDPAAVGRVEETLRRVIAAFLAAASDREDKVWFNAEGPSGPIEAWAHFGPGDDEEPVLTVMLVGED